MGMPSQKRLKELFDYDEAAGNLIWKARPLADFASKRACSVWNATYPGKIAGNSWGSHGYTAISSVHYGTHRLIWVWMYGDIPDSLEIDHRDGNPRNNRICNLRLATSGQNKANMRIRKDSRIGLKGVKRMRNKFQARLAGVSLGTFDTPQEAHAAYCAAANKQFGEFANHG
jgi:hypothetical protein